MSRFVRSLFTVALTLLTLVTLAPKGSADTLVDHPVGPQNTGLESHRPIFQTIRLSPPLCSTN